MNMHLMKMVCIILAGALQIVPSSAQNGETGAVAAKTSAQGLPAGDNTTVAVQNSIADNGEAFLTGFVGFLEPLLLKGAQKELDSLLHPIEQIDCEVRCPTASYFRLTPELDLDTGQNGAFQSIVAKMVGELMFVRNGDIHAVDDEGPFSFWGPVGVRHSFPVSVGAETTRFGTSYAVLGEIGYVPHHPFLASFGGQKIQLGFNPYFGLFFQGGYKFDGQNEGLTGGSVDMSSEPVDDEILRVKAAFKYAYDFPEFEILGESLAAQFLVSATGWYDIAHDDFYHSASATLRFALPGQSRSSVDLKVEDGSGAPNFNTGTQFGAGLAITF